MRVVRWILGIAGAVVLLAVAAALIAMFAVNPDRYRENIERIVQRETGRPFVLQGHLQLSWFPWLGVRTGAARLGGAPGAGPDLLDWRSAELRLRVLPLLFHRRLEVARIRIVGARIHLLRGPRGEANWDDLLARLHSANTAKAAAAAPAAPATWAGLELEDGSLEYLDERTHEDVRLAHWRLSVGPWRAGGPLSVRTSFVLHGGSVGGPATQTGAGAWRLPGKGVAVSLDAPRLQVDTSEGQVAAPRLSLQLADAKLQGSVVAGRDGAGQVSASGSLTAAASSLRELMRTFGIRVPELKDPAALGALSLSAGWSYREGALDIKPLAARLDSTTLSGWAARSAGHTPVWTFALRADQVDFGRYLTDSKAQKPSQLPVSALRALHAQGTLELGRARIDGTTLKDVRLEVQ